MCPLTRQNFQYVHYWLIPRYRSLGLMNIFFSRKKSEVPKKRMTLVFAEWNREGWSRRRDVAATGVTPVEEAARGIRSVGEKQSRLHHHGK
ncbi:hypothetical protein HNY73_018644 [Argiope bruennichi]|uniref:Uncharacterized protein n=1 Tax=Argiope bruennichi TaxID=94029 RepID=A0A8T0EHM9_ARGBR|nr:hypothetical protein HNY73_018644 [Argiope bruennichi]